MVKTTTEVRKAFLDFFESNSHKKISSGPLVPSNDPTLMFANAGMVQFKNIFTGQQTRPAPCATTVQKCIRISGKHNDLENVGRTSRHHTFFEMLGNFSFGDYFKEGACRFGWEFLTGILGFEKDKLWVSVFKGDDNAPEDTEAIKIWTEMIGVSPDRILKGDAKDNFWSMGDTGPCGPCSEVMYDRGEAFGEASLENGERFFEVWNLVFMQYMVETPGGPLLPLPAPCIDTGAGLERIVSILQGVDSNYDIDLFKPLVALGAELSGKKYGDNSEDDVSMRVIADHARMAANLISEGIFPEKSGREYVLRRVMRRAIRHGHRLGIKDLFFHKVALKVVEEMGDAYPELLERKDLIERICMQEEERFRQTLNKGLELLSCNSEWIVKGDKKFLPGKIAFDLSATYGFPLDLIEVIGEEDGFLIDVEGFAKAEKAHKEISGAGKIGDAAVSSSFMNISNKLGETEFCGYDLIKTSCKVVALIDGDNNIVDSLNEGETGFAFLDKTPFYAESGGQVGDKGIIVFDGGEAEVKDVTKPVNSLFAHKITVTTGILKIEISATAVVDENRRKDIARHHTATHLLHYGLRSVLGKHAVQKGSRVAPEALRFDFSHFEAVSDEQIEEIEKIANDLVLNNFEVKTTVTTMEEARAEGAMALFEENYGDKVRLVNVGDISKELCGGTHVVRSGDIGSIHITSESGVAAGVRRLEAVCGSAALSFVNEKRKIIKTVSEQLKSSEGDLVVKLENVLNKEKALLKEIENLKRNLAGKSKDLENEAREIKGVKVIGAKLQVGDPGTLRESADNLKMKIKSGVICLGGDNGGKAAIVVSVTDDLTDRLHAGKLIKKVSALIGGKGGGRADMAQAGGNDLSKLDEALKSIYNLVETTLT